MAKAWVGGMKIALPTLRGLLDDLEKMFPRDAGGGYEPAIEPGGEAGDGVVPARLIAVLAR